MNQRVLKKQLGLKSTLVQRDYFSCVNDEDRTDLEKTVGQYVELKKGDVVWILVYREPRRKVRKQ